MQSVKQFFLGLILLLMASPAWGAIAFVQVKADFPGSVSSATITPDSAITAGNALLIGLRLGSGTATVAITDDKGNNWTPDKLQTDAGTGQRTYLFSAPNAASGSTVITATVTGGPASVRWAVAEYSGLATSSILDQTNGANIAFVGTTMDSGNVTTTQADELLFGVMASGGDVVFTAGTSYTARATAGSRCMIEDRIVSSTGTYSASATANSSSNFQAVIGTYKAASAPASSVPHHGQIR